MLKFSISHSRHITSHLNKHNFRHVKFSPSVLSSATFSSSADNKLEANESKKGGMLDRIWGPDSNIASKTFTNRWAMIIPAFFTHMCIGSPYAWSMMGDQITREHGFVASTASDWTLMQAALPLSIVFGFHGLTASLAGKWQMRVGARKALAIAATSFGGGLICGAAGVHYHCLPLLYCGYGLLGGAGIGISYTPPIQTLFNWFPDKKGLASGLTVAGFGSGALVFTPMVQKLTKFYSTLPEYLGPSEKFVTSIIDGKLMADVNGSLVEVIEAGSAELSKIPYELSEGLYIVGSGSTGAAEALATMGLGYFSIMMVSSMVLKSPHPEVAAALPQPTVVDAKPEAANELAPRVTHNISVDNAMKTPQFYLLGATFFGLSAGGMGLFSVAKPMMSEVFAASMPALVTSAFAGSFVLMLSSGNLGGRIGWAAISDRLGPRKTFLAFTLASIPLYLAIPTVVENVIQTKDALPLYGFCAGTTLAVSMMGGGFSVMPAYEADLFGAKYVGAIHGRMLLFMSAASIGGPLMLLKLRSIAEHSAVQKLMENVSSLSLLMHLSMSCLVDSG